MERETLHKSTTEELVARMVMSWFNKNWHFRSFDYMELGARTAGAIPSTLVGMSDFFIKASAAGGKTIMKGFV